MQRAQQHFPSRLSDLYPAADDAFFTAPPPQREHTETQPRSPPRSNKSLSKPDEEHKYPESSSSQRSPSNAVQPRRQPSDLVEQRQQQQSEAESADRGLSLMQSSFGHDPFDVFGEMDRSFDAQMQRMGRIMERFTGGGLGLGFGAAAPDRSHLSADFPAAGSSSYSFHSSSSSYSAGADGSAQPFYRHVSQSSSCVDGLSASRARYEDSLGNRREQQGWGIGPQQREVTRDRNARGEERTHENLKHIAPETVDSFTQQWEQQRAKVDPKGRIIGAGAGNQQALKNDPIRSIKPAASADESHATRRQLHA